MFFFMDEKCPKCGRSLESSECLESTDEILKDDLMKWTCPCGFTFVEKLSPEEILDLEEPY